jgi:FKBP-type peptidyl-prolyl cis-trans isomerase 2
MNQKVTENSKVTVHYVGKLDDGNEFDNSFSRKTPLTFEMGKSQIIPGFESAVMNREVNEKFNIKIPKSEAYGDYSESNVHEVPKDTIGKDNANAEIGTQLLAEKPDGSKFMCIIKDIKDDKVVLDMNHPLAGQNLNFDIEILTIEEGEEVQ